MLNTLWSQATLNHNVPSNQKLGTFWIFTQYMTPMCPVVKGWAHFECSLLFDHNVPNNQRLGTFWSSINKWSQRIQRSRVRCVSNEIGPFDHTLPPNGTCWLYANDVIQMCLVTKFIMYFKWDQFSEIGLKTLWMLSIYQCAQQVFGMYLVHKFGYFEVTWLGIFPMWPALILLLHLVQILWICSQCAQFFATRYIVIIFLVGISNVSDWAHWGYITRAIQNVLNLLPLGTLGLYIG